MKLSYNLQYFAKDGPGGEKTEEPTSKRIKKSREDGQVAKSKEIYNGISLFILFYAIKFGAGLMGTSLLSLFNAVYQKIPEAVMMYEGQFSVQAIYGIIRSMMKQMLLILLPIMLVSAVVAFIVDLVQVKWAPTKKPLEPKFNKLNPIKGFSRLLSTKKLIELLKSIFIIILISYVAYTTLKDQVEVVLLLYDMSILQALQWLGNLISTMGIKIAAFYMIIAFIDYAYERHKHKEELKMTKQEVKDEFKDAEGDPKVKSQIRQRMMQVSMRRMMQTLPQADVVITNPTHYAVAIKYDPDRYAAPVVLAKGEDFLALKIKEKAKELKIEIVENKPLARMLYANVEIGELVPPELYQAVAEVLAMVYQMQGKI